MRDIKLKIRVIKNTILGVFYNSIRKIVNHYDKKYGFQIMGYDINDYLVDQDRSFIIKPYTYTFHKLRILSCMVPQNRFTRPLIHKFNKFISKRYEKKVEQYKDTHIVCTGEEYCDLIGSDIKPRYKNDGQIIIRDKKCSRKRILKEYPNAEIIDITLGGEYEKFSPDYEYYDIPVHYGHGYINSINQLWHDLKVYDHEKIEYSIEYKSVENPYGTKVFLKKKVVSKYGYFEGFKRNPDDNEIMEWLGEIWEYYNPVYEWVLDNKCQKEVEHIIQSL